jgi:copper chaperone NosL
MLKAILCATLATAFVFGGIVSAAEKTAPTTCKVCNGKIAEPEKKFSVTVLEGLEPSAFDDLGCAVLWYQGECAMRQSAFDNYALAHDHASGEPIPVEQAYYAFGPAIKTPAGHGIAAFRSRDDAEDFADKHGGARVLQYPDLMTLQLK